VGFYEVCDEVVTQKESAGKTMSTIGLEGWIIFEDGYNRVGISE